jgi:hypothetical protein
MLQSLPRRPQNPSQVPKRASDADTAEHRLDPTFDPPQPKGETREPGEGDGTVPEGGAEENVEQEHIADDIAKPAAGYGTELGAELVEGGEQLRETRLEAEF